jgi:hypothetical protein
MGQYIGEVIAGVTVAAIVAWLGLGQSTRVVHVHGGTSHSPVKKWKWCMAIGVAMILAGLAWAGSITAGSRESGLTDPAGAPGLSLASLGLLFFLVGKFFVWLNRR